jgi:hypothetical protein
VIRVSWLQDNLTKLLAEQMSSRAADSVETMAATMPALRDNDDVHFGLLRAAVESRVTQILEKTLGRTKFTVSNDNYHSQYQYIFGVGC